MKTKNINKLEKEITNFIESNKKYSQTSTARNLVYFMENLEITIYKWKSKLYVKIYQKHLRVSVNICFLDGIEFFDNFIRNLNSSADNLISMYNEKVLKKRMSCLN
jgi:exonuclease V gamma subunit|tara:strand:+ start:507 stop:824 length:318 start_codon:yes stop_codon:yes gene_type:complete